LGLATWERGVAKQGPRLSKAFGASAGLSNAEENGKNSQRHVLAGEVGVR